MRRGRKTGEERLEALREALRVRNDPIALEGLPLAARREFQEQGKKRYGRGTCAVGRAIADLLQLSLEEIASDLPTTAVGKLASAMVAGDTQAKAAKELDISEEHLTRRWKPVLVRLVQERLERLVAEE